MKIRQYYLLKLIEECAEVSQRASKSMQFGPEEIQKDQQKTNATRLRDEVEDLLTIIAILENNTDDLPELEFTESITRVVEKTEKVMKYLKYSQGLGMVEND